jgi:hypothetical protein
MEMELCESPELTQLDFCLWGWMNGEVYQIKVDTRVELFARIFEAAARIRNAKINSDEKTLSSHTNCEVQ